MQVCGKDIEVRGRLLRIGSPVGDGYHFLQDPEPALDHLRKTGAGIDLFTFMQKVDEPTPKYRYPMEWDNFAALSITSFENWWTKQLGFKARNKAKQAERKGVVIREVPFDDVLVKGIWQVYNECPVRQGRAFTHYGKDVETVHREAATFLNSSIFIGAYLGECLIGFIKLVHDETKIQAGMMNIVSMIRHRDKSPTNALVAQAVRSCADRGISYLVYSNFIYGKKRPDSIADFKERNAFQRIDVPRYYVPLTGFGAAAFRLGLHRRFVDRFPEPVVAKLRDFRNAWLVSHETAARASGARTSAEWAQPLGDQHHEFSLINRGAKLWKAIALRLV
jgi:hypothetical protein